MKLSRSKVILMIIILCFIAILMAGMFWNTSSIVLTNERKIEIHTDVDYTHFIKEVRGGSIEDVDIDSSHVNIDELGEYPLYFTYEDEQKTIQVQVVDTIPPECQVVSQQIALNQSADPNDFVENIVDATETEVYFKENYTFDQEGKQTIQIVVEDSCHNKTIKDVTIEVVKDTTPPTIIAGNMRFIVGSEENIASDISVQDDFDKNPSLTIEKDELDMTTPGHYQIHISACDASGNESSKTITIQVIDETQNNEKVVYLTFDDGPSKYTPEVLAILEQYHCKATFFVTGMNAAYRKYIKIAYDQGHTIGLHTYSHDYAKIYASTDAYFADLEKIGSLVEEYIGFVPRYIRFPGGSSNSVSKKYCEGIMTKLTQMVEEKGYIYYDWNAENGDGYAKMSQSEMLKRATSSTQNQIMILMHDANGKQNTVDILPQVIEYYQEQGYVFKAIDDSTFVPHQHVNN